MERIDGPCRARIPERCAGMAAHRHHRKLRRHGDDRPVNLLEVCAPCHDFIHRWYAWSQSWGLICPSFQDPDVYLPVEDPVPGQAGPYGIMREWIG